MRRLPALLAFLRLLVEVLGWRLATSIAASLALAFAEGAGLLLLVPLLATAGLAVDEGGAGRLSAITTRVFAWFGLGPTLPTVLGVFLAVSIVHALLYRTYANLNPALEQVVATSLRNRLYRAIVTARWPFLATRRSSDLVHAVINDVDRTSGAIYQLLSFTTGLAVAVVYVAVAAKLSWQLTGLAALCGAALLWLLAGRTGESAARGDEYVESSRQLFAMTSESIAGVKVAKSLGAEDRDSSIFESLTAKLARDYLRLLRSYSQAKLELDIATGVLVSALLYLAVTVLHVKGAGLLVALFVFARIVPRVTALQSSAQALLGALPSFVNVMTTIRESEAEAERSLADSGPRLGLGRGVRLDGIAFGYEPGAVVLHDVTLDIPSGSITGLAGASGAGKSTVADIVMGLLRPTSGRVVVGGRVLEEGDVRRWRRSIGYVPQDTFLLHDTVRANLKWAKPDATEDEMWHALDRAAATDFLRAKAEGLDTVVGDRGVRLSGGQRQRLALARALLLDPELLILDEATSALDAASERQILDATCRLAGTITVLLITHRLSTLKDADVIHVLADGRVAESGSWSALAGRDAGAFRTMLDAQAGSKGRAS